MAISIFPSTAAEFVSNNFVIDMNDSTNNTADTGGIKQAGPYSISFSSGDTSFDVYFIDEDGNSVGYSNSTSITATGLFSTVVILGVANTEIISFLYQGSISNADGEGDEPGAGAYLDSISPSDLPSIDDTATVTGGNFASDVAITFESGATVLSAKNIVRNSSTELVVTRPDALVEDDAPYTLKAINTGVTPPTGTNAHILTDAVTAGSDPTWVTTSPLNQATANTAFSQTLEATDSDGTVVDYSVTTGALPTGLTLNSSTGEISGTPTGAGQTFTVTATDDGGNTTPREFTLPVQLATGGTVSSVDGFTVHTFNSTDDFEALVEIPNAEYIILAGGGGGGGGDFPIASAGGGGGLRSSITGFQSGENTSALSPINIPVGIHTVTIGAGGNGGFANSSGNSGSDSSFGNFDSATGGGFGAWTGNGGSGGSGGGAASGNAGAGTTGQGFAGGKSNFGSIGAPGGGTFSAGGTNNRNDTLANAGSGTHNFLDQRGWGAGGGAAAGAQTNFNGKPGGGSSGNDNSSYAGSGGNHDTGSSGGDAVANFGGGGGGGGAGESGRGGNGGSGKVVVRYQ